MGSQRVLGQYPPKICDFVRPFTLIKPERIMVVYGEIPDWIIEQYSPRKAGGQKVNPLAMTIGYKTWYKPKGYKLETIFHEIKHSDQFWLLHDRFQEIYTDQIQDLVNTQIYEKYEDVPLEKAAYEFSEKMMNLWRKENGDLWTGVRNEK